VAYTDHEIGRVIQAVEDMGKLDNTLIIYINGDNGTSSEGQENGSPNEVAMFNSIQVPVEAQLKNFYDVWGSDKTYKIILTIDRPKLTPEDEKKLMEAQRNNKTSE
jgi:arylsulfatase